jgi:DNA-binding transcriptional ArsR family regulator
MNKEEVAMSFCPLFGALADDTRQQIIVMLSRREMSVNEIAGAFCISQPSVSHHLAVLRSAQLVQTRREGQRMVYSLNVTQIEISFQRFLGELK